MSDTTTAAAIAATVREFEHEPIVLVARIAEAAIRAYKAEINSNNPATL